MQRFLRIATRGWLNRAITIATFGYYPLFDGDVAIVADWCIEDSCRHGWTLDAERVLHRWQLATTAPAWTLADDRRHGWTIADDRRHQWTITDFTVECS